MHLKLGLVVQKPVPPSKSFDGSSFSVSHIGPHLLSAPLDNSRLMNKG